jgi:hypothetical protein
MRSKNPKPAPAAAVYWPRDLEVRYGISRTTRVDWEKKGRIPARDFHVGGVAEGWYVETLHAAERNEAVRP